MKKVIQICIAILVVCLAAATSTGFMNNSDPATSLQAPVADTNQVSILSLIDTVSIKETESHGRPVEPSMLFLFGVGIIGIITIHRLKFQ